MQTKNFQRSDAQDALRQFRVATFSGGVSANENGQSFQDDVLASMVAYGLRQWNAGQFKGVDGADGKALMQRAYHLDGFLDEQRQFKGVVIPQLDVQGIYSLCGVPSVSRRDLVAVLEGGRNLAGVKTDLVFHIELKYQDSVGSADDKSWGVPLNLMAGGADYSFILWQGIGAVPGTHEFLHRASEQSEDVLRLVNKLSREVAPVRPRPGQLFYSSTIEELLSQLSAIAAAEADGHGLSYSAWRAENEFINPSDVRTARKEKQARRDRKEEAQDDVAKTLTAAVESLF